MTLWSFVKPGCIAIRFYTRINIVLPDYLGSPKDGAAWHCCLQTRWWACANDTSFEFDLKYYDLSSREYAWHWNLNSEVNDVVLPVFCNPIKKHTCGPHPTRPPIREASGAQSHTPGRNQERCNTQKNAVRTETWRFNIVWKQIKRVGE